MNRKVLVGVLIVIVLVSVAGYFYLTNWVPLCQKNYELNQKTELNQNYMQNYSIEKNLEERFENMKSLKIKKLPEDAHMSDVGPTIAYYSRDGNRFWVVRKNTIGGDRIYGPFKGRPITCNFYPETVKISG